MVAVLNQCQHNIVAGKPGHQLDRVPPGYIRILYALQNMYRTTGFYQPAEQLVTSAVFNETARDRVRFITVL